MNRRQSGSGSSRWSLHVATIRGIPVRVHASFVLIMLFLLWRTGTSSGLRIALLEQAFVVAVFVCVAIHELSHAAAAVHRGVPIDGITLYPFGGVARMARRPPTGRVEMAIAAAGPAANLAIAVVILAVSAGAVLAPAEGLAVRLLGMLFWANLILAGFNLLPAFPLDGGRMLRGLLTARFGWARATVWAASVGQIIGFVLILVGLVHDIWLILGGLLILPAANAELRYAVAVRQFAHRRVGDIAQTDLVALGAYATVSEAAERSVASPLVDFLVTEGGRPTAYLSAARLWSRVRSDEAGAEPVAGIAEPLGGPIPADLAIEDAAACAERDGWAVAPVVDDRGEVIGIVASGNLQRAAQLARRAVAR